LFYILFKKKISYKEWFILWIVCLWGHSLVDIFTNYGTRIFLPFSKQLVSLNNISIADLFLTIPILILVIVALFFKNNSTPRNRIMTSALTYAVLYFGMTFVNKAVANNHFEKSIKANQISVQQSMSNPTILNNILWYYIGNSDSNLIVGEYSLLQNSDSIKWHYFPIHKNALSRSQSKDARMLEWFSQGFYITEKSGDTLNVFIPKFGRGDLDKAATKETFIFYYQIYYANHQWQLKAIQPSKENMNYKAAFSQLIDKIQHGNY